jgi:UDP-N-acetylglucosamine 2-epimerase (non-hydrolysing)
MKYALIVGTRPNFIKACAILHEAAKRNIDVDLIHTAQHYDHNMDKVFFDTLGIKEPAFRFPMPGLPSEEFFSFCFSYLCNLYKTQKYDRVIVVGDVNSTLIGALAAQFCKIPVVHVEAGLRSFDRTMPEEVNRILVDNISEHLFVTEPSGLANLDAERVPGKRHLVGNTMIDTLCLMKDKINYADTRSSKYAMATFHRVKNVDDKESLKKLVEILVSLSTMLNVVFPIHPRTLNNLDEGLKAELTKSVTIMDPLGYIDFLHLVSRSEFVITDSGGIQEETTFLGVPCLTLRESTERPITLTCNSGTNTLLPLSFDPILEKVLEISKGTYPIKSYSFWDGNAASRIFDILEC